MTGDVSAKVNTKVEVFDCFACSPLAEKTHSLHLPRVRGVLSPTALAILKSPSFACLREGESDDVYESRCDFSRPAQRAAAPD